MVEKVNQSQSAVKPKVDAVIVNSVLIHFICWKLFQVSQSNLTEDSFLFDNWVGGLFFTVRDVHISIKKKILFQFIYKSINVYTSCYYTVEVNQGFGLIKEVTLYRCLTWKSKVKLCCFNHSLSLGFWTFRQKNVIKAFPVWFRT